MLSEAQRSFLQDVLAHQNRTDGRVRLSRLADRKDDKVRQFCRRKGWVFYGGHPAQWFITDAGRAALAQQEKG